MRSNDREELLSVVPPPAASRVCDVSPSVLADPIVSSVIVNSVELFGRVLFVVLVEADVVLDARSLVVACEVVLLLTARGTVTASTLTVVKRKLIVATSPHPSDRDPQPPRLSPSRDSDWRLNKCSRPKSQRSKWGCSRQGNPQSAQMV